MTFAQYKRLLFVALAPLFLCGYWLANGEYLFEQHILMGCNEDGGRYLCRSVLKTRAGVDQYRWDAGGVWINGTARLSDGFSAEVITAPETQIYWENDEVRKRKIGGGIKKRIKIDRMHGAGTYSGGCSLDLTTDPRLWSLSCLGQEAAEPFQIFSIVDPALHAKYADAFTQERAQKVEYSRVGRIVYWLSFAVPLIAFLALSFVILILIRLARYIRGAPRLKQTDVDN